MIARSALPTHETHSGTLPLPTQMPVQVAMIASTKGSGSMQVLPDSSTPHQNKEALSSKGAKASSEWHCVTALNC